MQISLQLYSVHKAAAKDYVNTVKTIATHGWNGVEFACFGGLSVSEMKDLLTECNLYAVGAHCGMDIFKNQLRETLSYLQALGAQYMIIPGAPCDTKEQVEEIISVLNASAVIAREYGIKVGFHNHAREFNKIDGRYILDMIAEDTDDDVIIEPDVFWIQYAGVDPYAYVEKLGKKAELIHLKQIAADNKTDCILEEGILDIKRLVALSKYARHFIVEQEGNVPEIESSAKNAVYLARLLPQD